MRDIQQRIDELRYQIRALSGGEDITELERRARDIMGDAKNTPYEADARALFTELAQQNDTASPTV
ncbi:MAG: hypothetical protein KC496_10600 [Anaerolineae bacterium]|nr:hypothetical protein [Anaerolineae bacterium]